MTYNPKSAHAEEFINDAEILETLDYAQRNRANRSLIEDIINKAATCKGLTHREAAVLLECEFPDLTERYMELARDLKRRLYGNRIVLFAPLYLSNYCINGCVYWSQAPGCGSRRAPHNESAGLHHRVD